MNLSQHFTLAEFEISQSAMRAGIDNRIPAPLLANARRVAERLELVRGILNVPIFVSSGYRCPYLNTLVGGSKTSAHMQALAVDFTAPAFGKPITIARMLIDKIGYDQLIYEFETWVHLGIAPEGTAERHEVFHISTGTGYIQGLPVA